MKNEEWKVEFSPIERCNTFSYGDIVAKWRMEDHSCEVRKNGKIIEINQFKENPFKHISLRGFLQYLNTNFD